MKPPSPWWPAGALVGAGVVDVDLDWWVNCARYPVGVIPTLTAVSRGTSPRLHRSQVPSESLLLSHRIVDTRYPHCRRVVTARTGNSRSPARQSTRLVEWS